MHKDELGMTFFCDQTWEQMTPCEQGRLCHQCDKVVVDTSVMTHDEFTQFNKVRKAQGLCMKVRHDEEGQVIFAEPVALADGGALVDWLMERPKRLKTLSVAGAAALSLAACGDFSSVAPEVHANDGSQYQVHFDKLNSLEEPKAETPKVKDEALKEVIARSRAAQEKSQQKTKNLAVYGW